MKEFDENIENENNGSVSDSSIDCNLFKGGAENVKAENSEDTNGCRENTQKMFCDKREDNEAQKTATCGEEESDKAKADTCSEKGETTVEDTVRTYSSSYTPPTYTPRFYGAEVNGEKNESKKKKAGVGGKVLAATVILCVVFSFLVGAVSGYVGTMFALNSESVYQPKEELNILKNDGNITVNEITGSTGESGLSVAEVAAMVSGSVVEIAIADTGAAGSGVIFSQTDDYGYIVTNYHVVESGSDIGVRLTDGTQYEAKYIDGDEMSDIAVLKITKADNEEFAVAVLGSSEKLQVGEEVVAIGNPLGTLGGTVTNGIVSALDRQIMVENIPMTLLQHNAAINSGNSGGGLFNMSGELIGIVNAKKSAEGIEGLGFAIPVDLVSNIITEILEKGYISGRPTMGIEVQYGTLGWFGPSGVFVVETTNPLFKVSDRILSVDGQMILSALDYYAALDSSKIGKTVEVIVYRNNSQLKLEVTVEEYKPSDSNNT